MAESPQPFPKVVPPLASEPPTVKEINAWAFLIAMALSHVLEIVVCCLSWSALMGGRLSSHEYGLVVAACIAGPALAKARGKNSLGTMGIALAGGSAAVARFQGGIGQAARAIRDSIT